MMSMPTSYDLSSKTQRERDAEMKERNERTRKIREALSELPMRTFVVTPFPDNDEVIVEAHYFRSPAAEAGMFKNKGAERHTYDFYKHGADGDVRVAAFPDCAFVIENTKEQDNE